MTAQLHAGVVMQDRGHRWIGRCECGWIAVAVDGPGTEALIRSNLQLHLSHQRVKEKV